MSCRIILSRRSSTVFPYHLSLFWFCNLMWTVVKKRKCCVEHKLNIKCEIIFLQCYSVWISEIESKDDKMSIRKMKANIRKCSKCLKSGKEVFNQKSKFLVEIFIENGELIRWVWNVKWRNNKWNSNWT